MRMPQTPEQRWAWWEASLNGLEPNIHEDEPHEGFYKCRRFPYGHWPRGPYVPARIWWEAHTDPATGELISDERLCAEVDGKRANAWRVWPWLAKNPITESEWRWLTALRPLLPTKIPEKPRKA